jgi:hypothetical protein
MAIREILKMGDPRLLRVAEPVTEFDTPALHALIADMFDTMHAANGAGLAAPQIGVNLQLVIFGFSKNDRYPDAPAVPETVLLNPVLEPLSDELEDGWEEALGEKINTNDLVHLLQLRDDVQSHFGAVILQKLQEEWEEVRDSVVFTENWSHVHYDTC